MADNSYRLVLQCTMDNEDYAVEFDNIENENVNDTSDITNHPLVSGDIIADHMYRLPVNMTVTGTFSLYGNRPTIYAGNYNDRLTNIEAFFTRVKNEGIFCRLIKLSRGNNTSSRFLARDNMVLTSISWTEKQSSVNFTFNFTEAITAKVQDVDMSEDETDESLPAITDAATLDFTDTLLDWNEVNRVVVAQLQDAGLITQEFLGYAIEIAKGYFIGAATGIAIGSGVAILLSMTGALAVIPGPGWVAAGVVVAIGAIAGAIWGIFTNIKKAIAEKEYKIKQFQLYNDDAKNKAEVDRFCNYLGNIHLHLETLEDRLHLYSIASNEPQECMLYLDDNYYIFKFSRNNTNGKYGLEVVDVEGRHPSSGQGGVMNELVGYSNIGECTDSNHLFRTTGKGSWVYIINLANEKAKAEGKSQEEVEELNKDLTNYAVLVTDVNMSRFSDLLKDIIVDAMKR